MSEPTQIDEAYGASNTTLRVRLPGFVRDDEIGLGDILQRVTYAFGIKPCGGCEARAAAMNRWMSLIR
jgi:hypothetical protein